MAGHQHTSATSPSSSEPREGSLCTPSTATAWRASATGTANDAPRRPWCASSSWAAARRDTDHARRMPLSHCSQRERCDVSGKMQALVHFLSTNSNGGNAAPADKVPTVITPCLAVRKFFAGHTGCASPASKCLTDGRSLVSSSRGSCRSDRLLTRHSALRPRACR